ncbi:MAG: ribonuclease III [Alphaproteobacteria bacterium]|nr:ribonuclease III [Alphaproteobacteria bacterium]
MEKDFNKLASLLGHEFKDINLLKRALTLGFADHFSGYERLEFLGDRVLGLTVAKMLYQTFPKEEEGDLAKRFAHLVDEKTLAKVAKELTLDKYVICAHNERITNLTDSVIADICEATFAAIYLDSNFETAENFVKNIWKDLVKASKLPPVDSKTRLQELLQQHGYPLPTYTELERKGPDHEPIFVMEVSVKGLNSCTGIGKSKKEASQNAAQKMIDEFNND